MYLETSRLLLRDLTEDDFDDLRLIHGDDETMYHYGGAFPEETTHQWIELIRGGYETRGFSFWAVELLEEKGKMIGLTGITPQLIDGEEIPEIGYQFNRNFWKQGYAIEAASACRDYGFQTWDFERLVSWMVPGNLPSRKVAERNGMTYWKEAISTKTGTPHVVYSILRREWEQLSL